MYVVAGGKTQQEDRRRSIANRAEKYIAFLADSATNNEN